MRQLNLHECRYEMGKNLTKSGQKNEFSPTAGVHSSMLFGMMKSCARTYADLSRLYWRGSTLFNLDKVQKPLKAAWGYICPALSVFLVVVSVTPPFAKVDVMNARSSKPFPEGSRSARSGIGMICGIEEVGWLHISLVGGLVAINFMFPYIGFLIIPIDSYFSEGFVPTSNQLQFGGFHSHGGIPSSLNGCIFLILYYDASYNAPQMLMLMWNGLGCPGDTKKYRKTMGIYA